METKEEILNTLHSFMDERVAKVGEIDHTFVITLALPIFIELLADIRDIFQELFIANKTTIEEYTRDRHI
uniref:Uncharacterized protein n=1 Tax=viral metagenome TaxID=1070528 RepID=A0A6M3K1A4_9ZZZZ